MKFERSARRILLLRFGLIAMLSVFARPIAHAEEPADEPADEQVDDDDKDSKSDEGGESEAKESDEGDDEGEASEGEAEDDGTAEEGDAAKPKKGKGKGKGKKGAMPEGEPSVSETHVVSSGDTLWDLCTKYLNSPWYWPKIWSYNPQITNPHWIFPGNELRFYPSDENLPTEVAASRDFSDEDKNEEMGEEIPGQVEAEELVQVSGQIGVGHVAAGSFFSRYRGFISAEQQEVAGQITNSPLAAVLLSDTDRVYIKLKTAAKKGENFAIYRTVKEVEHPYSGETLGYIVEIVGSVTIINTSPQVATGTLIAGYREIERGNYVGPWPETASRRIQAVANDADIKAYIIDTLEGAVSEIGEHHVVFIDKGRSDGVKLGNTFKAVERGDAYTLETEGLPNEDIGTLLIVDVQERTAAALVLRSIHELNVGDKLEMRKSI